MKKYKISAVSYLNTIPFIFGLRNHEIINQVDLTLDNPSVCGDKLINNQADIGLVPVAILPLLKNKEIISDYCIGATGRVKSVILYSNTEINHVKTIFLDYQSKTSVLLARLLAKCYWNIDVAWINATPGYEKIPLEKTQAGVVIGDRSFGINKNYRYIYDLSEEWFLYTGLPFVFATWTSNKHIEPDFLVKFNRALQFGVRNLDEAVKNSPVSSVIKKPELLKYLYQNISYTFDTKKKEGLNHFLKLIEEF